MNCVIGGCLQPEEDVKRCYLNVNGIVRDEHASLDLCWFHQDSFRTRVLTTVIHGWDPIKEKINLKDYKGSLDEEKVK